jgi:putative ABC transport system permease protein
VQLFLGALTLGLILAPLAWGTALSLKICRVLDLTVDGAFTFGAGVAAALVVHHQAPVPVALLAGTLAGASAGACTGILSGWFRVDAVLAGVLTTTGLYSITMVAMGSGNISLPNHLTMMDHAKRLGIWLTGEPSVVLSSGARLPSREIGIAILVTLGATLLVSLLRWLFSTRFGLGLRGCGSNDRAARALGLDARMMTCCGLTLAGGLVGLSGALLAQYQGYADVQMGVGMLVVGLAAVTLGEGIVGQGSVTRVLLAALVGAVLYRFIIAAALLAGFNPHLLKLITALFVVAALVVPGLLRKRVGSR